MTPVCTWQLRTPSRDLRHPCRRCSEDDQGQCDAGDEIYYTIEVKARDATINPPNDKDRNQMRAKKNQRHQTQAAGSRCQSSICSSVNAKIRNPIS